MPTQRSDRSTSALVYMAIATITLSFIVSQFVEFIPRNGYEYERLTPLIHIASASLGIVGAAIVLLLYLRGNIHLPFLSKFIVVGERERARPIATDDYKRMSDDIARLRDDVTKIRVTGPGAGATTSELAAVLLPDLEVRIGNVLEKKYADKATDAETAKAITSQFNGAIERLWSELAAQSRRSNLNLVIGVMTTIIAVGFLIYMEFGPRPKLDSWQDIAQHYIPKLSIVIFIEVFAFFFLRLYKSTLEELKSYHDDLTRMTIQRVAVETAWVTKDAGAKMALTKDLLTIAKAIKPENSPSASKGEEIKVIEEVLKTLVKQLGATAKKHGTGEGED